MAKYTVGGEATLTAKFYNKAGALADPTAVTVQIKPPSGATVTYTTASGIVKDSVGVYHYDLALTKAGSWGYRFIGTGDVVAADEATLNVPKSNFVA